MLTAAWTASSPAAASECVGKANESPPFLLRLEWKDAAPLQWPATETRAAVSPPYPPLFQRTRAPFACSQQRMMHARVACACARERRTADSAGAEGALEPRLVVRVPARAEDHACMIANAKVTLSAAARPKGLRLARLT